VLPVLTVTEFAFVAVEVAVVLEVTDIVEEALEEGAHIDS